MSAQTDRAQKIAGKGTGLFAKAHAQLTKACNILEEAARFHRDEAAEHKAEEARANSLLLENTKAAAQIAKFVPGA